MAATYERKYAVITATATHINIPVVKVGSNNFAVGADWTPVAGDVKVSLDGGAWANIGTLPVATAAGNSAVWLFVFSAAELTCKKLEVMVSDAATKAIEDDYFVVETFGHESAMKQPDFTDIVRMGLTSLPNVASGSAGAIITSGTGTAQLSVTSGVASANATQWAGTTIVEASLPVATIAGAAGGLFIAGSNAATTIAGLTTGAISATTITASGAVAFQSTFAVTTSTSLAALSATTITASGATSLTTLATSGTTTLNALTVSNATTLSGAVSLGSTLGVTGATSLAAVSTSGTVTLNALTVTNVFTVSGATTLTGAVTASNASNNIVGAKLAATGLDLVLIDGKTLPVATRIIAAAVSGTLTGALSGTEVVKGLDGTTTIATATIDTSGNRTMAYSV